VADSDVHEAIQLDADISALVSPTVSELWRAMHGYPRKQRGLSLHIGRWRLDWQRPANDRRRRHPHRRTNHRHSS
jgi:hypothetical protein